MTSISKPKGENFVLVGWKGLRIYLLYDVASVAALHAPARLEKHTHQLPLSCLATCVLTRSAVQAGGNVTLDKITSAEIHVNSEGGSVTGRVLQGLVNVASGGGDIYFQRLVAPTVALSSGSGRVECRAICAFCSLSPDPSA